MNTFYWCRLRLAQYIFLMDPIYFYFLKWSGFPPIFLVSDWPRRHFMACFSEWVHRKRRFAMYLGFLFLVALNLPKQALFKKQESQRATYLAPEYNVPTFEESDARAAIFVYDRPEKYKLGRGNWDNASCQVSFNSLQRFHRRSRKCISQSEAKAAILFFRSARKTQNW